MATAPASPGNDVPQGQTSFKQWRRTRPFWGGVLLILSGLELFLSGNLNLTALQLHIGPTGFLSYVIPLLMLLCGVLVLVTPAQRLFYGVIGSLVAVYSLIGVNFGGFFLGLLLGIIGGPLTIAWSPVRGAEGADLDDPSPPAGPAAPDEASPTWFLDQHDGHGQRYEGSDQRPYEQPHQGTAPYGNGGYHEAPPREVSEPERWWGGRHGTQARDDEQRPPYGDGNGEYRGRMLAITLVPVTLAAALLFAVDRSGPAYADPCPLPGASASASASPSVPGAKPGTPKDGPTPPGTTGKASTPSTGSSAPTGSGAPAGQPVPAPGGTGQPAAPTGATDVPSGTGNPFVDGWNNFWNGVGKVLGIGNNSGQTPGQPVPGQPAPGQPAPGPTVSPSAGTSARPGTGSGGTNTGGTPAKPQPGGSAPGSPSASASSSSLPCLGAGIIRSAAADPGQPEVAATRGTLTGTRLVMTKSKYEGVADLPTAAGPVKVLKFVMDKSVTTNFQLSVAEPNGRKTTIRSPQLTTSGNVSFYTPNFSGKLFGLIPVTFTPDSPPPPTFGLPLLFTDVTIQLAYVHCDTLTALPNGAPAGTGLHLDEE